MKNLKYSSFLYIVSILSFFIACSSQKVNLQSPGRESSELKIAPVVLKKQEISQKKIPLKGKFLDYIYKIRPDHKAKDYSINTKELSNGYAFGSGPYDGWLVEFYLFQGMDKDIVFEILSGYEVNQNDIIYGYKISPYIFKNNAFSKVKLSSVIPIKAVDKLYEKQVRLMKTNVQFQKDWNFFRLIKFPIQGTNIELQVCKVLPDLLIVTKTKCVIIGILTWDKIQFHLSPNNDFSTFKTAL